MFKEANFESNGSIGRVEIGPLMPGPLCIPLDGISTKRNKLYVTCAGTITQNVDVATRKFQELSITSQRRFQEVSVDPVR